jgi:hypothetical protein
MTDILIGAADLYSWKDIQPWIASVRQAGFTGDAYLICYRIDDDIRQNAPKYNLELYECVHDPYGQPIVHQQKGSPTQAHNLRFYHAWELLTRLDGSYEHVIMTDVRDVIFQVNPSEWLAHWNIAKHDEIVAPSEHIKFANEPWNKDNLIRGYGQIFYELATNDRWTAYNVGTIAGAADRMKGLFHTIFSMTEGRYYPSDQSSWNVLLHTMLSGKIFRGNEGVNWAAQLGTTQDPTKSYLWDKCHEERPTIGDDGLVRNSYGRLFTIVHQWDRVPQLKAIIPTRYQ